MAAICCHVFSQTIKISNGVLFSNTTDRQKEFMNKMITSYSFLVGLDYLEHKYYYLSSEIGYTKLGGKENEAYIDATRVSVYETWDYIQANTMFRIRYPINFFHVYVGFGPKIDFLLENQKFKSDFLKDMPGLNRVNVGAKVEMGISNDFKRMRIGLNYSYGFNFMSIGSGLYNYQHSVMLSVGYKL